jgi:hypothetical protein
VTFRCAYLEACIGNGRRKQVYQYLLEKPWLVAIIALSERHDHKADRAIRKVSGHPVGTHLEMAAA